MSIRNVLLVLSVLGYASVAQASDPVRGKELSAPCSACHGADGKSIAPMFPNLGGQYEDYLFRALLDYKSGKRTNPIMTGQVAALSRQDMSDLAAFFSRQEGLFLKR